jgi:hypothetical protein
LPFSKEGLLPFSWAGASVGACRGALAFAPPSMSSSQVGHFVAPTATDEPQCGQDVVSPAIQIPPLAH